jgi:uncharacterized protein YecE (DUF72 family)
MSLTIGTAGWSIPTKDAAFFDEGGSSLTRYSSRFRGVEINSSFYRSHRHTTWSRWGDSVPTEFRFAVKIPQTITHQHKLIGCEDLLSKFLEEVSGLGSKLAVLLVQLPPKFVFEAPVASDFFAMLSSRTTAKVACEPRHMSWFESNAERMLGGLKVARVGADPALTQRASMPGAWPRLRYWRLHGSPVMYRSDYGAARLAEYGKALLAEHEAGQDVWCMFDNTAASAAISNALALSSQLPRASSL